MLQNFSDDFRMYFLMRFTEELIKNSAKRPRDDSGLIKTQKSTVSLENYSPSKIREQGITSPFLRRINPVRKILQSHRSVLTIPEPRLPERLQYLRPAPTDFYLDLGKLNPLIKDPAVRLIECDGPELRIIVKGAMGVKPTSIILREDEIRNILEKFANASKIPLHEGVFKVAVGKLILSAIISEVIPTRFIIEKMRPF